VKKRAILYSLCAAAMAMSGLMLGAGPASASINNAPGYFHIANAGSGKCIDATYPNNDLSAGYAQQWRCLNTAFEEWKYVPITNAPGRTDLFQIVNHYTGQCLALGGTPVGSVNEFLNGSPVVVEPCYTGVTFYDLQAWSSGVNGQLVNPIYGSPCLDLSNGDTSDGVPMQQWDCNPYTNNQRWTTIGGGSGGGGGGGCATSTPSSAHPAAIRPHIITCP
jgi:hypothetical protein